ncbi:MAG: hypothetical protein OEX01_09105 [Candidatus Bathyarchaeota archaeon]|nr:hypothetical protein [Candidatus Bathyarchaeota archaeon]
MVTKRELDRYLRSVEVKTANIIGYDLFTHNSGFTHKPSIHRLFAHILPTSSRREVQANLKTKMGICGRHPQFSYIRVFRTV